MGPPAGRQAGDPVQLGREPSPNYPTRAAIMLVANAGITVLPQVTNKRRTMKPQKLVAVGDAPLVTVARGATRRPRFHRFAILFETGQDFLAVVDLQNPMYFRRILPIHPARFEYDPYNILTRIPISELRHGVLRRLMVF